MNKEEKKTGIEYTASSEQEFIEQYKKKAEKYPKPSMTADINIFTVMEEEKDNYRKLSEKKLKLLMIRRKAYPFQGKYALPGGFVKEGEPVEAAARRELLEETDVTCEFLKQIHTISTPGRDPRGWIITTSFMALVDASACAPKGGDDAERAEWFSVELKEEKKNEQEILWKLILQGEEEELSASVLQKKDLRYGEEFPDLTLLSSEGIAFDHAWIIVHALLTLRRLVNSTDTAIVFELLPEKFTLTEIQQVTEAITGETYPAPAFRRKIAPKVEETVEYAEAAGHRPSKLFRRKQQKEM